MFTGIVRACGAVTSLRRAADGYRLAVDVGEFAGQIDRGDSVAVGGACLTVAELRGAVAVFDVSPETLDKCLISEWRAGDAVNLEPALTLQTPLGGHLLTGHIDAVGTVVERAGGDGFTRFTVETGRAIGGLIARKGCIAVDGVSLTVNTVADHGDATRFEVMVVPHTLAVTTLGKLQAGARAHLEVDILARYAARLLEGGGENSVAVAGKNSGRGENPAATVTGAAR